MHARWRLLALLAATGALAAVTSAASANRLSVSARTLRAAWFEFEIKGSLTVRCRATLEGTFHASTFSKVVGSLIGYFTRASLARPCIGGTAWFYNGSEVNEVLGLSTLSNSLPWHIRYDRFGGTLPIPWSVSVLVEGIRLLVRATFFGIPILCVYSAPGIAPIRMTLENNEGRVVWLRPEPGSFLSKEREVCPSATLEGVGNVTQLGEISSITVTLI